MCLHLRLREVLQKVPIGVSTSKNVSSYCYYHCVRVVQSFSKNIFKCNQSSIVGDAHSGIENQAVPQKSMKKQILEILYSRLILHAIDKTIKIRSFLM